MRTIAANTNSPLRVKNLGDIVTRRFCPSFFETDYVKIILPLLYESDLGAAGVLDEDGNLSGLLTERAILRHMFARSFDKLVHPTNIKKYLDDMMVDEVMIPHPETFDDDISIEDAAAIMLRRGYRYMPVVNRLDRKRLIGIVSERELAQQLKEQLEEAKRSENTHKSLLSYMLCEPYGNGYQPKEM
ncbi:MAG: CBS domain-containing protein [bacterium]|nr:CBS domain-containing protein [bacterium]